MITFEETDVTQQHIWKVDVATGAETKVTDGDWSVLPGIRVSRDGKHIAMLRAPSSLTIDHYRSDVWVLDLDTGALREVTNNGIYETEAELSPDNTQVFFIADANQDLDVYYGASLFVVPAAGGKPRLAAPKLPYTRSNRRRGHQTAGPFSPSPTWAFTARSFASTSRQERPRR